MEYTLNTAGLVDSCDVRVSTLYAGDEQEAFVNRLTEYLADDQHAAQITQYSDGLLAYKTESFIPPAQNPAKPNLMLVLGNPAPESIALGALFAYENNGKRFHRFWNVLEQTGIIQFDKPASTVPPHEKMQKLYTGHYTSPFNLFIVPFYSFSTPPGGKWSGVAGVKRLFGKAFTYIERYETERLRRVFATYLSPQDTVLVFQKDAYVALTEGQPEHIYNYKSLLVQPSVAPYSVDAQNAFTLACMLPTRLFHSRQTKDIFRRLAVNKNLLC